MAKKKYLIKLTNQNTFVEIEKEYTDYEYALISELFTDIYKEVREDALNLAESLDDDQDINEFNFPVLSIESLDNNDEHKQFKKDLSTSIDATIDNMSPQECRELFKAVLDSHIPIQKDKMEDNSECIDFSDVISSRLVNQTGPSKGLKLGSL